MELEPGSAMEDTIGPQEIQQRHFWVGMVHANLYEFEEVFFLSGSCKATCPAYLPSVDKEDYASFSAFKKIHDLPSPRPVLLRCNDCSMILRILSADACRIYARSFYSHDLRCKSKFARWREQQSY